MNIRSFIFTILFIPISLWGQTITPDTIPEDMSFRKYTGNIIYRTTVDTAITIVINELLAKNSDMIFDNAGDDDDWFEIYNYGNIPVRINNLWFTDNPGQPFKWKIDSSSAIYLEPDSYLLFWADNEPDEGFNHTSFKLSGDGEYLAIRNADSSLVDERYFGIQTANISYGRYPNGGTEWNFFTEPTPEAENNNSGGTLILPLPTTNHSGGIYQNPIAVTLHSIITESEIRYTLNCKEPNDSSLLYHDSIEINSTTIVRARIIKEGTVSGPVLTLSYLFESDNYDNPVISIVSDPNNLFGETGLISTKSKTMEIPANFEYIINSSAIFTSGTGIQLHSVKKYNPLSMRFYARSRYGNKWFKYPFFNEEGPDKYKRFILRNSGNDNVNKAITNSQFRDPLAEKIAMSSNENPMISASKPVNVFLNGNFYGLFNLRERIDEYYIETHKNQTENFDLLERSFGYGMNEHAIFGSFEKWDKLLSFADTTGDLSLNSDFQYISEQVDLKNFTDYWITEVFLGNYDWLSNNVKFWKPEDGKWQWIYWDMDHGIGLKFNDYGNTSWNTLEWSLTFSDRAWSNGYNNILIRNLLENQSYKEFFIQRFTHLLNTTFSFDATEELFEQMKALYQNDMLKHMQKWNKNINDWENACNTVKSYLNKRPAFQFDHLQSFFQLDDPLKVSISIQPSWAGDVSFGEHKFTSEYFSGYYFPGMDYELTPEPISGFEIQDLTINGEPYNSSSLFLTDSIEIKMTFIREDAIIPIQITEVFFNNREEYDSRDWIEFYNYGFDTLDLSGSKISVGEDNEVIFTFDEETFIYPNQYFIVAESLTDFYNIFPDSIRCFGELTHGFSNQSRIRLLSESNELFNEVKIMNSPGWPILPEEGYSLELTELFNNQHKGDSWEVSNNCFGSPGLENSFCYIFHKPVGKDSTFTNRETVNIQFGSSDAYFSDPDGHTLAAIYVDSVSGPGKLTAGVVPIDNKGLYEPGDFTYNPANSYDVPTEFSYRFIDKSGEESMTYKIRFMDKTGMEESALLTVKQYPNPAINKVFFEIPGIHEGAIDFCLMNLNGQEIQKFQLRHIPEKICVDLSGINTGIYLYKIETGKSIYNGKIEVIK